MLLGRWIKDYRSMPTQGKKMKTHLKIITVTLATAVTMGLVGCGSSSTTPPPPPDVVDDNDTVVVPDYAKKVTMDVDTAKKALGLALDGDTLWMGFQSANAPRISGEKIIGGSFFGFAEGILSFLNDFTHQYGGDYGEKVKALDTYGDESNLTLSCAYAGSYTIHEKWTEVETVDARSNQYQKEYTFNSCVHNAAIDMNFDPLAPPPPSHSYRYSYNGLIGLKYTYLEADGIDDGDIAIETSSFDFSLTEDGKKVQSLKADFDASFKQYRADGDDAGSIRFDMTMDGVIDAAEFNATSGEKTSSFVAKATELKYKGDGYDSGSEFNIGIDLDGYLSIAPDMNASHEMYLYGEAFKLNVNASTEDTVNISINGVLGAKCLGGSVAFVTSQEWTIDENMPDIDGEYDWTPFVGKTTIEGSDATAVLEFGKTADPKAYATLVMEGTAPVAADRKSLYNIIDDSCSLLFNE